MKPTFGYLAAAAWLMVLHALPASAQSVNTGVPGPAGKELRALRIDGDPPLIDGQLDEEMWASADVIDDFTQEEPDNMAPPTERTVVRIAYDDRYLYVAAHCYVRDLSQLRAGLGRRGSPPPSDRFAISLDPRHDHLTGYIFQVNPSGVQHDFGWFDDTQMDMDYEAVWEVRTTITADGWMAEFRIPFSQMRFAVPPTGRSIWGLNARREMTSRGESDEWTASPRGTQGIVSQWGHLIFENRLAPPRRLEVLPYIVTRRSDLPEVRASHAVDAGVDLRMGLGTSATLSATINPDFGQVEQDPAVLNLSVFETFFPEKRPFFLEDSRTLRLPYGQFRLFHSRRIGRAPGRFALKPADTLVRQPEKTTVLGAGRLTIKGNGWTYAALAALTAAEYATVDARLDEGREETITRTERLIEPRTLYTVSRIQRDVLGGTSTVGAIATAVTREQDLDALTGGGDYNLRWRDNRLSWNGHWVGTRAPIDGQIRSGFGGETNVAFNGKYLGISSHFDHFGRHFQNTDLGFISHRSNKNHFDGSVSLTQPDPSRVFRHVSTSLFAGRQWTNEGVVIGKWVGGAVSMTFHNFWSAWLSIVQTHERLDDLDTRGGPPILKPALTGMWIGLGAGGATYMAIMSALGCGNDSECSLIANASALPFIPAGALVGALIDRLIGPGNRTVYAARPQGSLTSVAVAPWLGKDGGGLSVKLRF